MEPCSWLLVFPPLIHSNWGNYYPSTALLSAALEQLGCSVQQIDLNDLFVDYLLEPERLRHLASGASVGQLDVIESLPIRAAANLLLKSPHGMVDQRGQRLPPEKNPELELATELARPYHVDLPVPELVSDQFATSAVARAYDDFFTACRVDRAICATRDAIGISVPMGPQLAPALLLARRVKRLKHDLKIVLGGPTLTLMADCWLEALLAGAPDIDAVVRFDGEEPIQRLATQIKAGQWDPSSIANVYAKGAAKPRERTTHRLRKALSPSFADELMARLAEPRLSLQQARGCYWGACAYCDFIELHNSGRRYDGRSVSALINEVQQFTARYGTRSYWLVTEALPPHVAMKFAEALIQEAIDIDWRSFAMVDPGFTRDVLTTLRRSGCSSLTIGLESMTTRVLRNVRKMADAETNLNFLEAVRGAGLQIDVNLIPNLPTTTKAEAMTGLALLERYEDAFRTVSIFPFEATQSSAIGRDPGRYGLRVAEPNSDALHPKGQAQFSSNRLVCQDEGMSPDELASVFHAYRTFARRVATKRQSSSASKLPGYQVVSPRTVAFPDGDQAFVYDWDSDRAWRLPTKVADLLHWMQDLGRPVRREEVATFLHTSMSAPKAGLFQLTEDILSSLTAIQVLKHVPEIVPS